MLTRSLYFPYIQHGEVEPHLVQKFVRDMRSDDNHGSRSTDIFFNQRILTPEPILVWPLKRVGFSVAVRWYQWIILQVQKGLEN